MSGYSSDVQEQRRSRNRDFIYHRRPGRDAFLGSPCPKCGAPAQAYCRRSFSEKSLPDTPRNRRLMAERTPPSHQERVDLFYLPGPRVLSERERSKRRARSRNRPDKRARLAARKAASEVLIDAPMPVDDLPVPDPPGPAPLSDWELQMAASESLGMDVSDLRWEAALRVAQDEDLLSAPCECENYELRAAWFCLHTQQRAAEVVREWEDRAREVAGR